jgi:maltose alpha-D-glucosyltransferase/alpha-amylase
MTLDSIPPPELLRDAAEKIPAAWLLGRRWFSSKGRTIESIVVADWGALPLAAPAIAAFANVRYTSGRDETYFVPLLASREPQPAEVRAPAALTFAHDGATWQVHDAFQFVAFRRLLMEYLLAGGELPLTGGKIVFRPEEALRSAPPPLASITLATAEQSNTSVIYDRQAILKCFRRVVAGVNPDVEVSHFLTMRAGFRSTPAMLGSITYVANGDIEHSLGMLQEFVPNSGDAWEQLQHQLGEFLAAQPGAALSAEQLQVAARRAAPESLAAIAQLGALTGALHTALACDPSDPEFAPRPLHPAQVAVWQDAMRAEREAILGELAQREATLPAQQRQAVAALLTARERIDARIGQLAALADTGVSITRFHGDYHLGQILVSERGFLILDFEGEPLRSLAERRAHNSPLKDVAGMLRSLSYAAAAAVIAAEERGDADPGAQRDAWADAWERSAREAFCEAYAEATRSAPFVPQDATLRDAAIAAFEIEKGLYELNYELNNRPGWLLIPLRGILRALAPATA